MRLEKEDKATLIAALNMLREQQLQDASRQLACAAASTQPDHRAAYGKNADLLMASAHRTIILRDLVLSMDTVDITQSQ